MEKVGMFYGSTMGETKEVAGMIANLIGEDKADVYDVASVSGDEVENYDNLILGSSTWGLGELQDDWNGFIEKVKAVNFNDKKVAIFGFGDQAMYSDTFVDAIGIIYKAVNEKGAEVIGQVSAEGYDFDHSEAIVNGEFVGLPLDSNNQSGMTEDRVKEWVNNLLENFQ